MQRSVAIFICLLLGAAEWCDALNIAAFNVQVFGPSKFSKEDVVATLVQIVQRYDIILIQELRDSSGTVISSFLDRVNSSAAGVHYNISISDRLGRTNSKEQYVFMYRTDRVEIVRTFQYNDSVNDHFEREPYSVLIRSREAGRDLPEFFLVGIHTQPTNAYNEINALVDVYEEAVNHYGNENGIILGDFNADCSYLSQTRYNMLLLVTDSRFTWLLDNDVDTTTGNSICAYDKIVVAGGVGEYVVAESAEVFLFDQEYGLTQQQALAVSDHYPVQFELQGAPSSAETLSPTASVTHTPTLLTSTPGAHGLPSTPSPTLSSMSPSSQMPPTGNSGTTAHSFWLLFAMAMLISLVNL